MAFRTSAGILSRRKTGFEKPASGFLSGTRIRTEHGERAVETLQPGDRIITRHGQMARISEVKLQCRSERRASPQLISIAKGAFGGGLPRRDLYMSPDQMVQVSPAMLNRSLGHETVQMAAGDLIWMAGVTQLTATPPITFVKILCDAPQVVYANGLPCGTRGLLSVSDAEPVLTAKDVVGLPVFAEVA